MAEPERADSILDRLTSRMGISARLEREKAVVLWEEVVGRTIASRAQAVSVKGGTLFVVVQNSTWLQEVSLMKEGIIENLNKLIGSRVIEDMMFRIGDVTKENGHGTQA